MDTDDKIDILAAILAIGAATLGARANEDSPAQGVLKQYDRIRDELRSKRDFLVSNALPPEERAAHRG